MTPVTIFKLFIFAFWCFIVCVSLVSDSIATKTIANVNFILKIQNSKQFKNPIQISFNSIIAEKNIINRNIFNVTGEIPKEDMESGSKKNDYAIFLKQPCEPPSESLPVNLVGIIYTGDSKTNLVAVQDPDIDGVDVYHEGDKILDYGSYSVFRIPNPTIAEFRYGGKKICRSLVSSATNVVQNPDADSNSSEEVDANTVVLTRDEITQNTGQGLSKLINTVRIAPSIAGGNVEGFKVFSITKNSLFDKIGLQEGDVVLQINDQKLDNPTKGMVIYESLQYENQIEFTIKRGTDRVTRKVIIK